jgi:protein ImuA
MSRDGRSEYVGFLRDAIARIEGGGLAAPSFAPEVFAPDFFTPESRAPESRAPESRAPTGRTDRARATLGRGPIEGPPWRGLARGALHEIVAASPGDAPAASGFALALAARFAAARKGMAPILWIVEAHAATETGAPYAPGLAAHGIDPARLVLVSTRDGRESLWAMEEALKCRALAAVVADIWRLEPYDLTASRRLVLAARKSGTPGLLVPAGAAGRVGSLASAAWTRFEVRARPGFHGVSAGARMPLPGRAAWAVRLARIRAGPRQAMPSDWKADRAGAWDHERFWPVPWDHEEACFCDAFSFPVPASAGDRSDQAWPARA